MTLTFKRIWSRKFINCTRLCSAAYISLEFESSKEITAAGIRNNLAHVVCEMEPHFLLSTNLKERQTGHETCCSGNDAKEDGISLSLSLPIFPTELSPPLLRLLQLQQHACNKQPSTIYIILPPTDLNEGTTTKE